MKKMNTKKSILLIVAIMLALAAGIGGTIAFLSVKTDPVVNTFEPAKIPTSVQENFDGTTKQNVQIKNNGNIPGFIRAALVFTWQDADGNTLPYTVTANDYSIELNLGNGATQWTKFGDYYYYNREVAAGGSTANLINRLTQSTYKTGSEKRYLCVEIIGSAIQAQGMGETTAQAAFAAADDK